MKKVIMAIRDVKAQAWLTPMFFHARGQGVRVFGDAVNGESGDIAKHPEDYRLFEIGTYDENSGEIVGINPEFVTDGSSLLLEVQK